MPEISTRHYETVKFFSEIIFVPLHWMMLCHWYSAASAIGTLVLMTYMTATWHHAKTTGILRTA